MHGSGDYDIAPFVNYVIANEQNGWHLWKGIFYEKVAL